MTSEIPEVRSLLVDQINTDTGDHLMWCRSVGARSGGKSRSNGAFKVSASRTDLRPADTRSDGQYAERTLGRTYAGRTDT